MSKFGVSTLCLFVGVNLLWIGDPVLSTQSLDLDRAIQPQGFAQLPTQPDRISADEVFDDIISNRVDKLKQFLSQGGSPD